MSADQEITGDEVEPAPTVGAVDLTAGAGPAEDAVDRIDNAEDEPLSGPDPLRFSNWMKRSATGAVMSGISIGLREALQPTKNQPAFVMEATGLPEDPDNPIRLQFDPDSPADTVAIIRIPSAGKDGRADPAEPGAT